MSNSTTKKFSPVTLPPQTSKSSFWQPPINDVQLQSSRFQAEEDTAGWQPRPNMGIENNLIMPLLQGSIQPKCETCEAEEKEPQIQTKLTIGTPGDPYEQEADQVAARVMAMSDNAPQVQRFGEAKNPIQMWSEQQSITPVVQRQVDEQVQMRELVQRAFQGGGTPESGDLESRLSGSKGGGSTLAPEVRAFMEPRFGADFSGVRVHTGSDAVQMNREIGAQAFTHGSDVFFGEGKSPGNNNLTAHELTHVVQQTGMIQRKMETAPASSKHKPAAQGTQQSKSSSVASRNTTSPKTPQSNLPESATQTSSVTTIESSPGNPPKATAQTKQSVQTPAKTLDQGATGGGVSPVQLDSAAVGSPNGVGVGGGSASSSPAPKLNTSSSEGLLESLANTPASAFSQAVGQSKDAAAQIQSQEKQQLETSLPEIERPTGLPPMAKPNQIKPTELKLGQAPDLKGASGRGGKAPETKQEVAKGPVPGTQVSTAVSAPPKDEGGGSWWNWLVNRVHSFAGSLPTTDPGLSTSAGSRPNVDLTGEANPTQNAQHQQNSEQTVAARKNQADQSVSAHFGENQIYPTVAPEKLKSSYKPTAPTGSGGAGAVKSPGLPDNTRPTFDQGQTPPVSAKVRENLGQYRLKQAKYQQESQETRQQGQQHIAQETEQVRLKQQGIQQQAKTEVNAERQRWHEENHKIQEKYAKQSKDKGQEIDKQIQEKVKTTEKEADQKLKDAENKADTERQKTEKEAAQKKREVENKPRSFWDSVKDTISSVFDSLKQTINKLFEGLRRLVKSIIEAAKSAVSALIEAARSLIVGLIKSLGEFLKGLVSVALAAFPEAAAKARAWIDKKVNGAVDTVNKAAEALKKATNAILDTIAKTLDNALSALQAGLNLILNGLETLTTDIIKAIDLIAKLGEMLKAYLPLPEGLYKLKQQLQARLAKEKAALNQLLEKVPANLASGIKEKLNVSAASLKGVKDINTISNLAMPDFSSLGGLIGGLKDKGITKLDLANQVKAPKAPDDDKKLGGGPGGGCGLCYKDEDSEVSGPTKAGNVAHKLIQAVFMGIYGSQGGSFEFPVNDAPTKPNQCPPAPTRIANPGEEATDLLICRSNQKRFEIGEIKPANEEANIDKAIGQMLRYRKKLQKNYPNFTIGALKEDIPSPLPLKFPTLSTTPTPQCQEQQIHVINTKTGIYLYACDPPFAKLKQMGCECEDKKKKKQEQEQKEKDPKFDPTKIPVTPGKKENEEKEPQPEYAKKLLETLKILGIIIAALAALALLVALVVCAVVTSPTVVIAAICAALGVATAAGALALILLALKPGSSDTTA